MNRIISLFLFIFIASCLNGQYNSPIRNKVTLGKQTTADGLVFRGVASIDTVTATSKITRANKQDTSAFILLDTVTNLLWHYKTGSNRWIQAGGSTFDTTTLNLVSRFAAKQNTLTLTTTGTSGAATLTGATLNIPQYSGGGGVDSTAIAYVNTYGTQTVNGAKTFTTAPTFSTALLGGSGGTGITTFGAQHRIPYAASTTALTTSSALTFDASLGRLTVNGINTASGSSSFVVNNSTPLELFKVQNNGTITVRGIGNIAYNGFSAGEIKYNLYSGGSTDNPLTFYVNGGAKGDAYGEFFLNGSFDSNPFQGGGFYFDTRGNAPIAIFTKNNNANPLRVARFFGNGTMNIGAVNDIAPTALLALAAGTSSKAPLRFTSGTNISTPEAGTVEFNGTNLFFTPSTTRHTVNHGLTGLATLDFPSTTTLLSADLTISVTGAADGDVVSLGVPNAAVNANTCYTAWVSAANTVTVRFNNYSSGTVNPASGSFKVFVTK